MPGPQGEPTSINEMRSGISILAPEPRESEALTVLQASVPVYVDPVQGLWFQVMRFYGRVPMYDMQIPIGIMGGTIAASGEDTVFINWAEMLGLQFGLDSQQLHSRADLVDRLMTAAVILGTVNNDFMTQNQLFRERMQAERQMGMGFKPMYVSMPIWPPELIREAEMTVELFAAQFGMDEEAAWYLRQLVEVAGRNLVANWYAKNEWPWALTVEQVKALFDQKGEEYGVPAG
jgi:hypothetical protein